MQANHTQLGYLGLLPFLALVAASLFIDDTRITQLFCVYSICIVSFLCGSLWQNKSQSTAQLWLIVLPTLLIPFGLFLSVKLALMLLAGLYVYLLLLQKRIAWQDLSADYRTMRERITSVVVICHFAMAAFFEHSLG